MEGTLAVDYYHFLVVRGPRTAVDDFSRRIALVVNRRVAGVSHQSIAPFSFESMFAMARMKGDVPHDPYDVMRWPTVQRGRTADVRYRFHTRSLEVHPLLRRLSKAVPRLDFALVTWCLDDEGLAPFRIQNGRLRGTWLPPRWGEQFWERAAAKHKVPLDDAVYEHELVRETAEKERLDAAVEKATGTPHRYTWYGGRVYADLDEARADFMLGFQFGAKEMDDESSVERETRRARKTRTKHKATRASAGRRRSKRQRTGTRKVVR